jgi:hypothetical protein
MAKRSQATKDADVSMQTAAVSMQAANGGSAPPPPIAADMDEMPLVPANDAPGTTVVASGNGSPREPGPAVASGMTISLEVVETSPATQEEPAPQPAEASLRKRANGSVRPATHAAEESPRVERREVRVADISKNRLDSRGENIDFVFFMRRNCFAIYLSNGRILVQYADDDAESQKQVANIAELLPLRDRLQYVLSDMTSPHDAYHWQIAESLRLGLVGQKDVAKRTMQAAIENTIAVCVSDGRTAYLRWAGLVVIGAIALLAGTAAAIYFLGSTPEKLQPGLGYLMLATGGGSMGAMLSTAIALRARTVGTDGSRKSNVVDSATRIMIGVISAAVLYLLLDSNALANFSVSIQALARDTTAQIWKLALLTGFAAGFLERLVPNLLENKLAPAMAK